MIEEIKQLKKIELHLHLDGSVSLNAISSISGKNIEELKNEMIAPDKCKNLSDYLTRFETPLKYMQNKENLYKISKELSDYLVSQNVVYAEVRFAPMFHTQAGLSYDDIIETVLKGLKSNNKVKINLILCMMRGFSYQDNLKTIEVASKYLNKGVCCIDLAGAEDKYPLNEYIELFKIATIKNIPFIIHAGENGSHKEIELAIELGAKRIGHGIHAINSLNTMNMLKERKVTLELCPTSNVQTNAVDMYANHPIRKFFDNNINLCINTDNKTVSNITLNEEYIKLYNQFKFTIEDFKQINNTALEASFLSQSEKEDLKKTLN